MIYYLIICRSLTYAQRTARVLERSGITGHIQRAPKVISREGCGYCVRIAEQRLTDALRALRREGLTPKQVFLQNADGESSPGRGGYPASMGAARVMYQCRELAARLFHVPQPEQVVLTANATHALNLAIHSLVRPGSVVLISGYEHNAVTRPLCGDPRVQVRVAAGPLFDPDGVYEAFERELTEQVDVVICNHVSNVFGFIQPVERIAALCRRRGKPLIVDASQSAGTLPVDLEGWGAAFVAMPGHKGLYGPQGTGLLLCGRA